MLRLLDLVVLEHCEFQKEFSLITESIFNGGLNQFRNQRYREEGYGDYQKRVDELEQVMVQEDPS